MSRDIILARRARLIAAGLAALGAAACGESRPGPCLSVGGAGGVLNDGASGGSGGNPSDAASSSSGGSSDAAVDANGGAAGTGSAPSDANDYQ